MGHAIRTTLGLLLMFVLAAPSASAGLGDKLFVQKASINVRTGPGTDHPVLMKVGRGQELLEFSRKGDWVNVGIVRSGGKDGWIHVSLVGAAPPSAPVQASPDRRFTAFVRDVEALNSDVAAVAGFRFFSNIENKGDGIVQLRAHDQWLGGPESGRRSNLKALMDLWEKHEGSGHPTAVYIVDSGGRMVMKASRP